MDESKKLTRTAIISFVIATLCYTIMWFMMRSAEKKFFGDYIGGTSGSGTAVQILVSVLAGVILFLLPLEKIGQKACAAMEYCGSLMTIGKKARHEAAVVMTVIFYVVICWLSAAYHIHANIEYNSSGRYGSFGADSAYIYICGSYDSACICRSACGRRRGTDQMVQTYLLGSSYVCEHNKCLHSHRRT